VSTWLEKGSYKGEMKEVVWDEEGEMMKLPTRPATWSPPDPHSKTHRSPPPNTLLDLPKTNSLLSVRLIAIVCMQMGRICMVMYMYMYLQAVPVSGCHVCILPCSPAGSCCPITQHLQSGGTLRDGRSMPVFPSRPLSANFLKENKNS
jgi:hypothetical protein